MDKQLKPQEQLQKGPPPAQRAHPQEPRLVEPPIVRKLEDYGKKQASVFIDFYENGIKVKIDGYERLTPRKIQRSLYMVYREWNVERKKALLRAAAGKEK